MPKYTDDIGERTLPDIIDYNLDLLFINVNQHHYSGQGNQFFRLLYESDLTNRLIKPSESHRLLDFRMGLLNMVEKPAEKKNLELSPEDQQRAQETITQKIRIYKPKIIVYNGKPAIENFYGCPVSSDFNYGKQPKKFESSNIYQFCLPSSAARLRILPTVSDKVPFYTALKKLRDFVNGLIDSVSEDDLMFPDFKVTFNNREINESLNVDSGEEENDEDTSRCEDPEESKHKISYRQNNIPLSQIPNSIIEEIRKQRKTRKSVTIATSKEYLSLHKKTPKLLSVCAPGSTCSDPDTHSTMTNDSDYENSKPMTPNNEKIMSMINQAKSQGAKNMQMNKTDSGKKINTILSENKSSGILQRPAKVPKIVQQNRPHPPPVQLHVEPVNFETVEFELVKKDQYRFDDFYRFDTPSHNSNMHYLLSDDYYQNLKQDLGRKLKFSFLNDENNDMYEDNEYNMAFQSVAEASSYVLTGKRKCFVNVHNL